MEYSIGYYNIIIQVYSNLPCCPLELGSVECGMSAIAHTASHSTNLKNMYQTAAVVPADRQQQSLFYLCGQFPCACNICGSEH